ncbi:MAG: OmpA family protein [Myxococcota bacterium]
MWTWMLVTSALASGLDADGSGLPVHDGALTSPALLARAPLLGRGGVALGLRTALDLAPLVRTDPSGESTALIGSAGMGRLQGAVGILDVLSATADLPVRFAATSDLDVGGPALGDASATLWVRPVLRRVSLGLGGGAQLPTGRAARFSGSGRAVPHARLSLSTGLPWELGALVGVHWEGPVDPTSAIGGVRVDGGVSLDRAFAPFAAGVAVRADAPLAPEIRSRRGVAVEAGLHGAWQPNPHVTLDLLATRALGSAAGAPTWRFGLGAVAAFGRRGPIYQPQAVVREVRILDPDGVPVAGAGATFEDGETLVADADGVLAWSGDGTPIVSGPGLTPRRVDGAGEIRLDWAPIPLRVVVATETGEAVDPVVALVGEGVPELSLVEGTWTTELLPGTWELRVSAEGYGGQSRAVDVLPGRTDAIALEVVLLPVRGEARLDLSIADPQGNGVLGAEVRIDGIAIGTSAQGLLGIDGLEETTHEVAVDARYFVEEVQTVDLTTGSGAADLDLYYAPGTVRVTAFGPTGPIRDGTVFFQGPRALPPLVLGDHGERLVTLTNGTWACVLSSPAFGLQERSILVEPGGPVPINAEFRLLAAKGGNADVIVRLADPDGNPLEDVGIALDGVSVGRTGTGGQLRLFGLQTGPVTISARGEALEPGERSVELRDGLQATGIGLSWRQGAVRVAASSPEGPADAFVEFDGPAPYEGGALGDPGRRLFQEVPAGEWEIVASHEAGMEVAWTVVNDEGGRLTDVAISLGEEAGDASLVVSVTDPSGAPVDDALVVLDGRPLATTASGGRVRVSGLDGGLRSVSIRHPTFETWTDVASLTDGEVTTQEPRLDWREGVLELVVTRAGAPVTDAVAYIAGSRDVAPLEPGTDGRMYATLGPGTWDVLVSSPSAGLAERTVTLPEGGAPTRLEVELNATTGMMVQVMDDRGLAVPEADIRIDDAVVGTTDSSGTVVVELPAAGGRIQVSHPHLEPVAAVTAPPGLTEQLFEGRWRRQDVPVRIRHDGRSVTAQVGAMGPGRVEPVLIEGSGAILLPPGRWDVLVSADDLAVARKTVDVIPGVAQQTPIEFELGNAQIRITAEGIELRDVRFDLDSDVALDRYATVLEEVAATLIADSNILEVEVQGHTDSLGDPVYNYDLSRRRAQSVVQALVELGVPPELLVARGYGPSRPVSDNATDAGRALNRRVDFRTIVAD